MVRKKRVLTEEDMKTRAFTLAEAGQYLSLTRKTLLKMCNDGTIKAVKLGNDWRISKAELDRLLAGE